MKKQYIILLLTLFSLQAFSQNKGEKIKTLKIAFITEKLNLTKAEAQKFWPVYNAYETENNTLRNAMREQRKATDINNLSETEAKTKLKTMLANNDEKHRLFNEYIKDLQGILPAKKIILLKKSEDEFKNKMFEEYKKRHNDKK
ncbi:Spy/CpxP family protein refolding chaperone [Formosa haliotis]|uniref:Spy/CpxP family protein refolding chaperone n=1 Tax=Formosa haliotis TaxID=1555194 RepID=UPI000826AC56|nr:Spy/CpxP family protein refolding chaperone [Formosa haliotis]